MCTEMLLRRVFEQRKRFIENGSEVEDKQRVGCPCYSKTDDNFSKKKMTSYENIGNLA